jgi:hypothetical protein
MDNRQTSQGAHAGAFSIRNQQSFLARFFLLALLLILSVASLQSKAPAQTANQTLQENKAGLTTLNPPNCDECQQAFVECLAGGGGVTCHVQYNICIQNCH